MKIKVTRVEKPFHFKAENESGNSISIDGSPKIGGQNNGPRPMELLIMGLGGCSGIDVLSILQKQNQQVDHFEVDLDAARKEGEIPSLFEDIKVIFKINGPVDPEKARRACDLSMQKYCSVSKTLEKTAKISYSVILNGAEI